MTLGLSDSLLKWALNLFFSFGKQLKVSIWYHGRSLQSRQWFGCVCHLLFMDLCKAMIFNFGNSWLTYCKYFKNLIFMSVILVMIKLLIRQSCSDAALFWIHNKAPRVLFTKHKQTVVKTQNNTYLVTICS